MKKWSRDEIKYLALFTMFLNHFAQMFLSMETIWYEVLSDIGYFTAPIMCYFLAEGYNYTHSKKKYGQRLFLFALLSEIPFLMAMQYPGMNMIFTLFLCFMMLYVQEQVWELRKRTMWTIVLVMATLCSDWALLAPYFTYQFWKSGKEQKKIVHTFGMGALLFSGMNLSVYLERYNVLQAVWHAGLASTGILAAGIVILYFYSGKQSSYKRKSSKWFFYLFYPLHLLVLCGLRFFCRTC